jgi:quercetin dioxygenase-like cupin family protein
MSLFPQIIRNLPQADIPLKGAVAFISQSENHQILFMEFSSDVILPEHSHSDQVGFILQGKIEMNIAGEKHTYTTGDVYHIPAGVKHSAKIYAGYCDITFFNEPNRYKTK